MKSAAAHFPALTSSLIDGAGAFSAVVLGALGSDELGLSR